MKTLVHSETNYYFTQTVGNRIWYWANNYNGFKKDRFLATKFPTAKEAQKVMIQYIKNQASLESPLQRVTNLSIIIEVITQHSI